MRPKHYPSRTCVACRTSRQKRELVRVVRTPDGRVVMDETGRLAGRGAYLCADGSCWQLAVDKGTLQRALETPLPPELREQLVHGARTMTMSTTTETMTTTASLARPGGDAIGQE